MSSNGETHFPVLPLIHSLGGCGGTLLAQLLGVLDGIVLFSECSPASASLYDYNLNPYRQLQQWHPDVLESIGDHFTEADLSEIEKFGEFIALAFREVTRRNERLIVRDYNYADYIGVPFAPHPAMQSSLLLALESHYDFRPVVMVRHPLYQYDSLRSHPPTKDTITPDIFLAGYQAFLDDFREAYTFKYEDLIAEPARIMRKICKIFELPFSESIVERFHENRSVTGNLSRLDERRISPSMRPLAQDEMNADLQSRREYFHLLDRMGYVRV